MAFQVNSNVAALNVYNNLGVHQAKAADSLARISSGLKSAGAGDVSSAGAAAVITQNRQATMSNISLVQNAINQLQVADAVYGEAMALVSQGIAVAATGRSRVSVRFAQCGTLRADILFLLAMSLVSLCPPFSLLERGS